MLQKRTPGMTGFLVLLTYLALLLLIIDAP